MKVTKAKLPGVLVIEPEIFEDFRGFYVELFNEARYRKGGIAPRFVEDDFSVSTQHVLRGIHTDQKAWKLISCLHGSFYLVIVNCDPQSKRFGAWESFTLSAPSRKQVLVPPKHGVAHLVLSDTVVFHYKQSEYYDPKRQKTYRWDDKRFKIWWPVRNPILSERDELGHYVS